MNHNMSSYAKEASKKKTTHDLIKKTPFLILSFLKSPSHRLLSVERQRRLLVLFAHASQHVPRSLSHRSRNRRRYRFPHAPDLPRAASLRRLHRDAEIVSRLSITLLSFLVSLLPLQPLIPPRRVFLVESAPLEQRARIHRPRRSINPSFQTLAFAIAQLLLNPLCQSPHN